MLWDPSQGFPLPRDLPEWLALSSGIGFSLTNVLTRRSTHLSLPEKSIAVWGGVTVLALELVPRTTKAQTMDVLSSQATVAGYQAVLLGASHLARLLPMLTTAAGTIAPW